MRERDGRCRDAGGRGRALDLASLVPWHAELAAAVDELARSAGSVHRWSTDDAVVVLVRALTCLARSAPTASSPAAAALVCVLAGGASAGDAGRVRR